MLLNHLMGRPWAVSEDLAQAVMRVVREPERFAALRGIVKVHASVDAAAQGRGAAATGTAVAVLPLIGSMTQRGGEDLSTMYTSTDGYAAAVRAAAADPAVDAIVLEVDSPGGEVFGVTEAAATIREARKAKPVVAIANSMAASAAYALASQATEVMVTPSGVVGSVGVYMMHVDESKALEAEGLKITFVSAGKYKVEGNSAEPLAEEARDFFQSEVDRYYGMFVADVAKGRGVPVEKVRKDYGSGRVYGAPAALEAGMVDGVGTLQDAIRRAMALATEKRRGAAGPGAQGDEGEAERRLRARRMGGYTR